MFDNIDLFIWTVWHVNTPEGFPEQIAIAGQGPFIWSAEQLANSILTDLVQLDDLVWLLDDELRTVDFANLLAALDHIYEAEIAQLAAEYGTLVVGRTGWSEDEIFSSIEACAGQNLKIYSEEMLVSFLLSGRDPFDEPEELLLRFAAGHPALEYIQSLSADFDWPSTYVSPSFGNGSGLGLDFSKDSLPGIFGYRVGKTSPLSPAERRTILDQVIQVKFTAALHDALEPGYLDDWGDPGTPERVRQLAVWLASMCTLEKRRMMTRGHDLSVAIQEREDDLAWLKSKYYHGRFRFRWPSTYVEQV